MSKIFAFNRALAAAGALLLSAFGAQADIVRQYPACNPLCVSLPPGFGGDFTARTVKFHAPRRGTLILSFQGTLHCTNNANRVQTIVVKSQIVDHNRAPDAAGPSGLEFAVGLAPSDPTSVSATFNLASTRVFKIRRAGDYVYRFRLNRFGIPEDAGCSVRYGSFLAHFVQ